MTSDTHEFDPLSIEAFFAAEPNAAAQEAEAGDRTRVLNTTEQAIVVRLRAQGIPGASNLSIIMKRLSPAPERQLESAVSDLRELRETERHPAAQRAIERDISLALAIGAIAEATTATGSDPANAAECLTLAEEEILDPQLPDGTRQALGAILLERTSPAYV